MNETHKQVDAWSYEEFPFTEDTLPTLGEILPPGYWFAIEHTPDGNTVISLMKHTEVNDE